ncbi:hypothetical protein [Maribacter sp. 2307ULW6-5]|uniref:hypothetical protein n=1 Tax=Maribacter sp. 2307ULW6-5 TaxID=3386275 RepID=UPI0039BCEBCF
MKPLLRLFLLAAVPFLIGACSEELDFDQYEDLQLRPELEASIVYVRTQESLINRISGVQFYSQDFNFDAFEAPFFADRVLEGTIAYHLENTTSKPIAFSLSFLDVDGNALDVQEFNLPAAPPAATMTREVNYGPTGAPLDILRNTTTVRISGQNLGDNITESPIDRAAIVLRSTGRFTFRFK